MKGFRFVFGNDKPDNTMVGFTIREESEEKAVGTAQTIVEALDVLGIELGEFTVHTPDKGDIKLEDVVVYLPAPYGYKVTSKLIEDEWE